MKPKLLGLLTVATIAALSAECKAAFVETPLPNSAYITVGDLDWAWGYPAPASYPGFDLSYQSQFGWHVPTAAQLASAPDAISFLFPGANVPFAGVGGLSGIDPISGAYFENFTTGDYLSAASAGACATPWFSTIYRNCDWADGQGQPPGFGWAGTPSAYFLSDQLVVRDTTASVPGPIAGAGLPGLILASGGLLAW